MAGRVSRAIAWPLIGAVRAYRLLLSPWLGRNCRFQPTCSAYALEALQRHGAWRGSVLAARRLARCHPFGGSGFDPVPDPVPPAADRRRDAAADDRG